ncbi:nucleoside hydrolase [Falsibacillus pallidus]|uniref:Purine nucleosidase n=1 Tax=Falsibacillus pallidus TaxID=493781 RepID=A0A370G3P2_9BACI|nr:nucleoside hydrolase [Falsibacillus pallidus]RDI38481.1 purine nucleosidase [Falsibacillus pallidus]
MFTDPGIDDSIAIMYALLHPGIKLVGIVSSYGNMSKKDATKNIAYLLHLAGKTDIPLIGGATRPLSGKIPKYYPEIHGEEGLGPISPPDYIKGDLLNFSQVFDIIEKHPDLTIVDVGRSTSLATAIVLSSEQIGKIKQFHIMGGAFLTPGNVTEYAEANFYGDPIAVNLFLANYKNITIVPLNATNKGIITKEIAQYIVQNANNQLVSILQPIIDYYIDAYKKLVPGIQGAPLHDVVTLFLLMNPGMGSSISRDVNIERDDKSRGQSIADFRPKSQPSKNNINIYMDLNYSKFVEDFIQVMIGRNIGKK